MAIMTQKLDLDTLNLSSCEILLGWWGGHPSSDSAPVCQDAADAAGVRFTEDGGIVPPKKT
jgi:hypothetical protein